MRDWLKTGIPAILATVLVAAMAMLLPDLAQAQAAEAKSLIEKYCVGCHPQRPAGGWYRISEQRKTPEGWDMNIIRMDLWHNVKVPAKARRTLVKFLSDTQGLAPAETAKFRYILERRPNVVEDIPDETLAVMCARCHSYARVALQRQDAESWEKVSAFHLGQFPTIEYHALARDRNWWEIASGDVPKKLGEMFPRETSAWSAWKNQSAANLAGSWRVTGHQPGKGGYVGSARITRKGDGRYSVSYSMTYLDGSKAKITSNVVVYTKYEWRGAAKRGKQRTREVFAVSEDGNTISGRWFLANRDEVGGDLTMVRQRKGFSGVLKVNPAFLRAGSTGTVVVYGTGLSGKISLGAGVSVDEVIKRSRNFVIVKARAGTGAAVGGRTVRVGGASAEGLFTVYNSVDSVKVVPGFGISRVGGGKTPPVTAQFEAVAYANGADGKPGTEDDVRIGVMPARWKVDNLDDSAKAMKDKDFAGKMRPGGLFMPAQAGPNPRRKYRTNNVGNLAVIATVKDRDRSVTGQGTLVATVQRWNDPPIR